MMDAVGPPEGAKRAEVDVHSSESEAAREANAVTVSEVVELVRNPDQGNAARLARYHIESVKPDVAIKLNCMNVTDFMMAESIKNVDVLYATGDSDDETIRDFESGPGRIRFSRREPYFYKLEMNNEDLA